MFFEKLRYVKLWMFFVKPCHRNLRCSEFSREFVLSCLGWVPVSGVKVPATLSSARPQLCSWGWTFSTPLNGYSWLRCLSTVMLRPAHFSPVADHRAIYVRLRSFSGEDCKPWQLRSCGGTRVCFWRGQYRPPERQIPVLSRRQWVSFLYIPATRGSCRGWRQFSTWIFDVGLGRHGWFHPCSTSGTRGVHGLAWGWFPRELPGLGGDCWSCQWLDGSRSGVLCCPSSVGEDQRLTC